MKKPSFSVALMVACAGLGGSGGPAWKTAPEGGMLELGMESGVVLQNEKKTARIEN